jgi:HEPN domain-containing protein
MCRSSMLNSRKQPLSISPASISSVLLMSKVRQPSGEDHPEAAAKHLDDAQTLFVQNRWDGAAYLSGYVVECALKAVILVGNNNKPGWPGGGQGHNLSQLTTAATSFLSAVAFNGRTAKYAPLLKKARTISGANGWSVFMRYMPAGHINETTATAFFNEAEDLYKATVIELIKDGLL